ncbi:MAG TPA: ABC transporter ATP-binding protein [Armatimonadetes bacterium]|nr:ABC transporter ATP-binding protein [Armatimonadota bacterium]
MAKLRIHNITVRYDSEPVLEGFSLDVNPADFAGIIGPNGSGKTTLLRTIARVLKPVTGAILLDELDMQYLPVREVARHIGVVPQTEETLFAFTVFDVVAMGRTPHRPPWGAMSEEDLSAIEEAMMLTGVYHLSERLLTELSGGERRRVMIARAVAQQPRIMLLDEPTANLDLKYQLEVMELIRRLNRERNMTVLVVMHDLNLAALMADKLILMNRNGRIHAMGTPEEVITQRNIQEVYGAPVIVSRHPLTGKPTVTLLERRIEVKPELRIHVICGGGSAGEVLSLLAQAGCIISAGALNRGDSDWEVARALGVEVIEEAPFMPISDEAYKATCEAIARADIVLITDVPFGWGNLPNLRAVLEAGRGRIFIMQPRKFAERDFTDGRAQQLLAKIYASKQVVEWSDATDLTHLLAHVEHAQ